MKFLKIIKSFTLSFSCTGLLASPVFADTFTGATGAHATGTAAIAIGLDAGATGLYSIAIGKDTSAASPTAIAIGESGVVTTVNNGSYSILLGHAGDVTGVASTGIGYNTSITGHYGTTLGANTTATADFATAIGYSADATHANSVAIGDMSATTAANQIVLGRSSHNLVIPNLSGNGTGVVAVDNTGQLSWSAAGAGSSASFTSGTINGVTIGATTASTGAFTTLTTSGNATIGGGLTTSGNATIGGDLAVAGSISSGGKNLIKREADGAIHIGENSLITVEKNGTQQLYGQDASGNAIPIDITNGSKLLINGRDVEQSINNVGALSAALTGLPTVPTDTKFACGLGSGTHGGEIAFAGGCASRVNEKLAFNAAASFVPGQDYQGNFKDSYSARAGFIWKLGKSIKPIQISINEKKEIDLKISKIEKENKKLKEKNSKIISQNELLLSRINNLEELASKFVKSKAIAKN